MPTIDQGPEYCAEASTGLRQNEGECDVVWRATPFPGDDEDKGNPQRCQEGQHADIEQEVV